MSTRRIHVLHLLLLILSGEAIFVLPFVLQRVFRATVLEVFQINNTELGVCFSAYGIAAMVSYLLGGPIADRHEPRKLIALALWLTAIGGIYFAQFPTYEELRWLYAYWGITSILLFWSPMLKAARIVGGGTGQSKAYGFLDGGRGMVAALIGLVAVGIFGLEMPVTGGLTEKRGAMQLIIYFASLVVAGIGVGVWAFLKTEKDEKSHVSHLNLKMVSKVLSLPSVRLLMGIVLCGYVAYKITDIVSLYAVKVLGYDEVKAAQVAVFMLFLRPLAGFFIGFYGDRLVPTRLLKVSFIVIVCGSFWFVLGSGFGIWFIFIASVFVLAMGIFAVRALYFAVQQEGKIPLQLSGTAVGFISVVGFTPDVFAGVLVGLILDHYPDAKGFQMVFMLLVIFGWIGWWFARRYARLNR